MEMAMAMATAMAKANRPSNPYGDREKNEKADKLTMDYIFTRIDGIASQENQVFILTTNHKERLDAAFVRDGRIGDEYHMSNCTREMLADLCIAIYELDKSRRDRILEEIPGVLLDKLSPTRVISRSRYYETYKDLLAGLVQEFGL
jgi:hypothetical protein